MLTVRHLVESGAFDEAIKLGKSTSQAARNEIRETITSFLGSHLVDYLIPVFADGDTGHQSVKEMVRLFVKSNAAGIHLEDQAHGTGYQEGRAI